MKMRPWVWEKCIKMKFENKLKKKRSRRNQQGNKQSKPHRSSPALEFEAEHTRGREVRHTWASVI